MPAHVQSGYRPPGSGSVTSRHVPDASLALYDERGFARPSGRMGQRRRRSTILAGARHLLAKNGYERLSIQELASELEVSKQTVYNLIGTKRDVAIAAIIDHLSWMAATVSAASSGSNMILDMVDLYCENLRSNPDYFRQAALAMFQRDRSVCAEVRARQQAWFHVWLRECVAHGRIREGVDLAMLARQLVVLNEANMLDYANGMCDEHELLPSLVASHGLMLRGASTRAESERVDAWMEARLVTIGQR